MKYFVKDEKIHRHPVPESCHVEHKDEQLYLVLPQGKECDKCFGIPVLELNKKKRSK